MSECGPEVMQALRPHRSALMGLAELATSNPHMRVFLRHVAEMQRRLEGAEREAQQWHTQCSAAEVQDRLEAFFYEQRRGRVHEALREEAQRDPVGSVLPSAAAAAPRGGSAGGEPHRAAARPLYGGSGRPRNVI